mgnify:CR=1 FL=1
MKKIVIIILALISSISAISQDIKGRVYEISKQGSEIPVIGANVYWEGTTIGTTTDKKGTYIIQEPPSLPATLNVSYIGYTLDSKQVVEGEYIFYLRQSIDLQEVEVEGKQNTTTWSTLTPRNVQTISTGELVKAACCNLSECFETNATVDVTYADAISGLKTIQMLGLDGFYVQINNESMPLINGLLSSYGLSYVPGSWIESIQITKGMGSVLNGHDGFTGQINLEYFTAENEDSDRLFWGVHANSEGKFENNILLAKKSDKWTNNLFTHISYLGTEIDHHGSHHDHAGDGFLDMPKVRQFNVLNKFKYIGFDKIQFQFSLKGLFEERIGGQKEEIIDNYLVDIHNDLFEMGTKTGYINPEDNNKSIGLQTSWKIHDQQAQFGNNKYSALQERAYLNLMINTYINNTDHILRYGLSYSADRYTEDLTANITASYSDVKRVDLISGIFSEYNFTKDANFNLNTGFRADYYNITNKIYYSPRLNIKYNPSSSTVVRFSLGKGFRIPNVIVDNLYHLASAREITISDDINPEEALNFGANFSYCFYLFSREGTFNFDAYRTVFHNKLIVDIEEQSLLRFSNLEGEAYANSIQFDLLYELFDRLDLKAGYKINKSYATYSGSLELIPLKPQNRALLNLAYATDMDKWKIDLTANYIGESRIPEHTEININNSDPFTIFNTQITRKINEFDLYLGCENISDYTQEDPIINAENPFDDKFDASLIWAPVMGRMLYVGARYRLK